MDDMAPPAEAPDPGITIVQASPDAPLHGDNRFLSLTLAPAPGSFDQGKIFMRRAVKQALTPDAKHVNWMVGELNGVRVYCDGTSIIMTTLDLWP